MKLLNKYYNFEIELIENQISVLTIENPAAYSRVSENIWNQVNGGEGDFILSKEENIKLLSKEVECIFNPFAMELNSKKIIGRLYQELKEQCENLLQEDKIRINSCILDFLDKVAMKVPYNLKYNCDIDLLNLFKLYGIEIEQQAEGLLDKIVEYLKIGSQICGINIYVFIDLKHYLNEDEMRQLYEFLCYQKIHLIIIEPIKTKKCAGEKSWIIDNDLCIIEA